MHTPTRLLSVVVAVAAASLALSACAAGDDGGQSKTDACIIVSDGLEGVQEQIAGANTALTSGDLLSVQANLKDASDALTALAPKVTNTEISAILGDLTAGLDTVREAVTEAGTQDPDAAKEALAASGGDLQSAATRFNEACGS